VDSCEDPVRSCERLNFLIKFVLFDMLLGKKSIVLLKMFRLTTLFSQLVEWFYLGRKTKIQISQLLHGDMYELSRQVFNSEMSLITVCKYVRLTLLYFSISVF
jgi:hypothetical protein